MQMNCTCIEFCQHTVNAIEKFILRQKTEVCNGEEPEEPLDEISYCECMVVGSTFQRDNPLR